MDRKQPYSWPVRSTREPELLIPKAQCRSFKFPTYIAGHLNFPLVGLRNRPIVTYPIDNVSLIRDDVTKFYF